MPRRISSNMQVRCHYGRSEESPRSGLLGSTLRGDSSHSAQNDKTGLKTRLPKAAAVVLAALLVMSQLALAVPCALADSSDTAESSSGSAAKYRMYLVDDADIFTDA